MQKHLRSRLLKCLAVTGFLSVLALSDLNSLALSLFTPNNSLTSLSTEVRHLILPSTYSFILNQPDVCERKRPFLVLMIPLTVKDTEARAVIRKTWGQNGLIPGVNILRFFVIGQPMQGDPELQGHLERESMEYADIIQMDFVDSYYNLTIKTMMIMNWIGKYCQRASYAMKIDADIFLNVPYLVKHLLAQSETSKQDYITGSVIRYGHAHRNTLSKWYLSKDLYPHPMFPRYLSGAGYVFSTDLAKKISLASRYVQPVPLEDVYVGLCLHVLGVSPVSSTSLAGLRNLFEMGRIEYERCTFAKRIIVTGFTPQELLDMWHDFQSSDFTC